MNRTHRDVTPIRSFGSYLDDMKLRTPTLFLALFASLAQAGDPEVTEVRLKKVGMVWNVYVTLSHGDEGWDHYADGWEILDADGNRLGFRKLMHPHVEEQPFTRSLSGVVIPDGTREIYVRPHCSVHGWSKKTTAVRVNP